ncbi:hypothetical protein EDB80DRAFT_388264 [Ilyonectria destructans]|nr:hypothetical protein EDB80DRAFT_388264 [Ilyonectria destructans]
MPYWRLAARSSPPALSQSSGFPTGSWAAAFPSAPNSPQLRWLAPHGSLFHAPVFTPNGHPKSTRTTRQGKSIQVNPRQGRGRFRSQYLALQINHVFVLFLHLQGRSSPRNGVDTEHGNIHPSDHAHVMPCNANGFTVSGQVSLFVSIERPSPGATIPCVKWEECSPTPSQGQDTGSG